MIVYALSIALLAPTAPGAKADSDFSLRWDVGEVSRDASNYEVVWTLAGNVLSETSHDSGRVIPKDPPTTSKTTTLTDTQVKELAALLVPLDAIKPKTLGKPEFREGNYTDVQLTHGKHVIKLHVFEHIFEHVPGEAPKLATPAQKQAYAKLEALRAKILTISQ